MGDQAQNFIGRETERHRPHYARHHAEIVKLADRAVDAEPMDASARVEVDHLHAAPGLRVGLGELPVERQALEALIARLRQPDEGIFAVEGEPTHEARTEGEHLELGLVR